MNSDGSEARRHHWVPQFFLRGFTQDGDKRSQLYVVDCIAQKVFRTLPTNVAVERDFNMIEVEGHHPNAVESGLSDFEGKVTEALRRIEDSVSFADEEDRLFVLNFVALLAVRNPRTREMMRSAKDRTAKIVMNAVTYTEQSWASHMKRAVASGDIADGNELSYETFRDFVAREDYDVTVPTTEHVRMEIKMIDAVLPYLVGRKWQLIRASADSGGFVTTDHPVVLVWKDIDQSSMYPPGFGLADTEVLFPLSRRLLISGKFGGNEGSYEATMKHVACINAMLIQHGRRQVYACDENFRYLLSEKQGFRYGRDLLADTLELSKLSKENHRI